MPCDFKFYHPNLLNPLLYKYSGRNTRWKWQIFLNLMKYSSPWTRLYPTLLTVRIKWDDNADCFTGRSSTSPQWSCYSGVESIDKWTCYGIVYWNWRFHPLELLQDKVQFLVYKVFEGKVSNVGASDFEVKRVATSPQPNPEGDMDSSGYMTCYYINRFRLDIPQIEDDPWILLPLLSTVTPPYLTGLGPEDAILRIDWCRVPGVGWLSATAK